MAPPCRPESRRDITMRRFLALGNYLAAEGIERPARPLRRGDPRTALVCAPIALQSVAYSRNKGFLPTESWTSTASTSRCGRPRRFFRSSSGRRLRAVIRWRPMVWSSCRNYSRRCNASTWLGTTCSMAPWDGISLVSPTPSPTTSYRDQVSPGLGRRLVSHFQSSLTWRHESADDRVLPTRHETVWSGRDQRDSRLCLLVHRKGVVLNPVRISHSGYVTYIARTAAAVHDGILARTVREGGYGKTAPSLCWRALE
jgi:hypothetical protein